MDRERFLVTGALGCIGAWAVKRLVDDGALGEVFFVSSSRVNLGLHQRDVSVVWDLGPHDFSILVHWLGEQPVSVRAVGRDSIVKGIYDVAFVTLNFASGAEAARRSTKLGRARRLTGGYPE